MGNEGGTLQRDHVLQAHALQGHLSPGEDAPSPNIPLSMRQRERLGESRAERAIESGELKLSRQQRRAIERQQRKAQKHRAQQNPQQSRMTTLH